MTAVVNEFPAPSQSFIRRKLRGLADAGVEVTVAASTFNPDPDPTGFTELPLTPWRSAGSALRRSSRRPLMAAAAAALGGRSGGGTKGSNARERALAAPLLSSHSQIVHFEFSGIAVTYRHALSALRPAKLAISCRGAAEQIVPKRDPARIPLLNEVFGAADLIHCVSDDIRATAEDLGAPPERILVNRPAVPVAEFEKLATARQEAEPHDGLRVLSIGRLHWKKGFDDSLRAIRAFTAAGRSVEYRIAGEGVEREKLSFLIDEYGLKGKVSLLGTCTSEQILEQLLWADVLLLPSLSEGISNAVLEAMSSGLPVVSTNCGGMGEVIDDGADGYLVEVGDVEAMSDRLILLDEDRDLRTAIGASAIERARAEFDISRQVKLFVNAYRAILSN